MKRQLRKIAAILLIILLAGGSAFGAEVQIINPVQASLLSGDSFLVSIKLTGAATVRILLYEIKEVESDNLKSVAVDKFTDAQIEEILKSIKEDVAFAYTQVAVGEAVTHTSEDGISFYTKQINDVKPGIYELKVELLDSEGEVESETISTFVLKEKAIVVPEDIFKEKQATTGDIIKKIIKSIFG